jgi:hypothetical protein
MTVTGPVMISAAAAAALTALIGAASRLGLPQTTALGLMVPLVLCGLVAAVLAGASLSARDFFDGTGAYGRNERNLVLAAAALLMAAMLGGADLSAVIGFLPAIVLAILARRFFGGAIELGAGTLGAINAAAAILMLAAACFLVLPPLCNAVSAVTGTSPQAVRAMFLAIGALSVVIGGQRAILAVVLLCTIAACIAAIAILAGFLHVNAGLTLPFFSPPATLEALRTAASALLPDAAFAPLSDPAAAVLNNGIVSQAALGLAIFAFLALVPLDGGTQRGQRRGTASALIIAVLMAYMLLLIPLNALRAPLEQLVGFDPSALPLWLSDGRFRELVIVCAAPLDLTDAAFRACEAKPPGSAIGPGDLGLSKDYLVKAPGLAAGLPAAAGILTAFTLAVSGSILLLLIFVRLAMLVSRDFLFRLRQTPSTGSWTLAMTRLVAIGLAVFLALPIEPHPALHHWLALLSAGLIVPQLLLSRVTGAAPAHLLAAALTGATSAAAFMILSFGPAGASLAGVAAGLAAGCLGIFSLRRTKVQDASA